MSETEITYKAIIIDDELRARVLLQGMLETSIPEIEVVAQCEDLATGIKAIKKFQPDLVYLDIEMPGNTGLELLDFFNDDEIHFSIIFTTAYSHYAIKAFKLSAIDYLLKPIEQNELVDSFERFKRNDERSKNNYSLLKENLKTNDSQKLAVPSGNSYHFIEMDEIHYLKAEGSYTQLVFTNETRLIVSRTLKNFEEILSDDSTPFFRCHKSFLVNSKYMTGYNKSDGHLLLKNNVTVPVSPDKINELMMLMKIVKR
ncbi:MAG TPA: LytTR family DNA-binding domain-containing protein [Fluviicola sp.]|nr:LytTR family DNA-binding domain-containing protein [Fluviicola sp.]